ncbi:hypothetical protein [Streptomyces sp. NPDC056821]|uniref:hypothetical protein n=1 Tax=unclassified Streptomyces TaxID=2593676 RepID=UPI0036C74C2B
MEWLHETYEAVSGARATHMVEFLDDAAEVAARYDPLLKCSSDEVLHLVEPPYATADEVSSREVGVRNGVRLRSVYERGSFTDAASRGTAQGGQLRLASRLPVKLVVFDRTAALRPVRVDRPTAVSPAVHAPALV